MYLCINLSQVHIIKILIDFDDRIFWVNQKVWYQINVGGEEMNFYFYFMTKTRKI